MKPFLSDRLFAALLLELSSGHYGEEARFLSLREISSRFGVSKPTCNLVHARLLKEGLLVARPRSGSYVARGARERAMLLLEKTPLSTIPTPRTWVAHRSRLLHRIAPAERPSAAIVYYSHGPRNLPIQRVGQNELPSRLRSSQGCLKAARERNVDVSFALHDGSEERHREIKEWLASEKIGGVLVIQRAISFRQFHEIVDPLLAAGLPVVNAFGDVQGADVITIDFNNVAAGFQAAKRVLDAGCRRLTMVTSKPSVASSVLRVEGARLAAEQHGVEFRVVEVALGNEHLHLPPLFEDPRLPEAVIGVTFDLTVLAFDQAAAHGFRPGTDFFCIAFSSIPAMPGGGHLDIMKMDFDAIGAAAMHALLDEMEGQEVHRTILIPLEYQPWGTVNPAENRGGADGPD